MLLIVVISPDYHSQFRRSSRISLASHYLAKATPHTSRIKIDQRLLPYSVSRSNCMPPAHEAARRPPSWSHSIWRWTLAAATTKLASRLKKDELHVAVVAGALWRARVPECGEDLAAAKVASGESIAANVAYKPVPDLTQLWSLRRGRVRIDHRDCIKLGRLRAIHDTVMLGTTCAVV